MTLTDMIKIGTLVLGMVAFIYLLAWVFQGATEEDERGRRPFFHRLRGRKGKK